jgi:exopolysaccharide biosynthesis polyprenyl glycosylphosphotransferase
MDVKIPRPPEEPRFSTLDPALQVSLRAARATRAKAAPRTYSRGWKFALFALDLAMLLLAAYVAGGLVEGRWEFQQFEHNLIRYSCWLIAIWLIIFERVGLYHRSFALSVKDEFYYTVLALIIGVLPQLTLFTILPALSPSRLALLASLGCAVVAVGLSRALVHAMRNSAERGRPRRIAIVGHGDRISSVAQSLSMADGSVLLRLDIPDIDSTVKDVAFGGRAGLESIDWFVRVREWGCDTLLLTEVLPPHVMPHLLAVAAQHNIKFAFAPPRVQCHAYSLSLQIDGQQALIVPSQLRSCTPTARLLKRLLDLSVAVAALIILWPFLAVTALIVWLDSGRPILYRQTRVGRDGEVFDIFKFRSMRTDAEAAGPAWVSSGDSRTTRVGGLLRRTSLDELPQLFNVVRGEMSIVGPRPARPLFIEEYRKQMPRYDERHLVRPGITGWAQVHMKRVTMPEDEGEKLSYDLFYVENWSLFMDLSVIFKTAFEFLFRRAE